MTIILALAVFAVSASATVEEVPRTVKPSGVAMFCTKSGEQVSGLTKICYYNCARSEGAMTATTYESLDATLAVEPKQSIWTKGKFTVAAVGKI